MERACNMRKVVGLRVGRSESAFTPRALKALNPKGRVCGASIFHSSSPLPSDCARHALLISVVYGQPMMEGSEVSRRSQTVTRPARSSQGYNPQVFLMCVFGLGSYASRSMLIITQLGNYFGALANWVRLQDAAAPDDKLFFSVVGWHALTLPQDPKALLEARTTMIALILASGVDPRRSIVFHQDEVSARSGGLASCAKLIPAIGSKPHRALMDSELHDAAWEAEADDHLESTCQFFEGDSDDLNSASDTTGGFKKR